MPGKKIVVIGDEDAVFGLGLIGLTGHVVTNIEQARLAVQEAIADRDTALILLTENWAAARPDFGSESSALVVEIPSREPVQVSVALRDRIEQALGMRLER